MILIFSYCIRPLCGHGIYTGILPPPGRSQLMRPRPPPLLGSTKEIRYIIPGPRLHALAVRPSPSSPVPRPPARPRSPILPRPRFPNPLSAPVRHPLPRHYRRPSFLHKSSSTINRRLPLTPTSVVARNSKIAAVHRSSPKSLVMVVFVRFLPVALPIARHMVACWSFHRRQCLKRCSRVFDCLDPGLEALVYERPLKSEH
jgi:hypothetical protein